jgi:phosphatidylglycerophosphate synthase
VTAAVLFTADALRTADVGPIDRVDLAQGDPAVALADQLSAAGAECVWALARPDRAGALRAAGLTVVETLDLADDLRFTARLAAETEKPLLLCAGNLVANDSVLGSLAAEPPGRSLVLVAADRSHAGGSLGVRAERIRMVEVIPRAQGGVPFLGALRIVPNDLAALAAAADHAAERAVRDHGGDAADLLLTELAAAGVGMNVSRVRLLYADRVTDAAGLAAGRATAAAIDEDAARLRLAVKEKDDFFATYAVSSWSPYLTRWAARVGLTPTAVTMISLLVAVVASAAFVVGSRPALVLGGVLLYLDFVLDCVDGQLARYTRRFSAFGGWLDTMADRTKEYLVYAGLAAGAVRSGLDGAWVLAVAAIALQTVRHMTDTWYGALHDEAVDRRAAAARRRSAEAAAYGSGTARMSVPRQRTGDDGPAPRVGPGERLGRVSNRVQRNTGSVAYWLKRIVVFPIGERWALIALTAALFNGRVALLAALVWASLAAAYTLVLRSLRSRAMRVPLMARVDLPVERDDGPLVLRLLGAGGVRWAPVEFAGAGVLAAAGLVIAAVTAGDAGARWWLAGVAVGAVLAGLPAHAPHDGALDWLVPAALRAVEFMSAIALGIAFGVPAPYVFALLFALALHFYDLTARMEKGIGPPALRRWTLGWDGRVAVLVACAALGWAAGGMLLLAGYVLAVLAVNAGLTWLRRPASPVRPMADVPPLGRLAPARGRSLEELDR